jgi:hypothetical protein
MIAKQTILATVVGLMYVAFVLIPILGVVRDTYEAQTSSGVLLEYPFRIARGVIIATLGWCRFQWSDTPVSWRRLSFHLAGLLGLASVFNLDRGLLGAAGLLVMVGAIANGRLGAALPRSDLGAAFVCAALALVMSTAAGVGYGSPGVVVVAASLVAFIAFACATDWLTVFRTEQTRVTT